MSSAFALPLLVPVVFDLANFAALVVTFVSVNVVAVFTETVVVVVVVVIVVAAAVATLLFIAGIPTIASLLSAVAV